MLMISLDDAVKVAKRLVIDDMDDDEIIRQELEQKCWIPFPWPGHEQEEQSCTQEYVCAGRQPDSQIDLQHGAGKDQKQHRCTCTGQKRHSRQGKHHDDQQKHGRPYGLGVRDREMIIQIGVGCFTGIEKTVQDALHPQPGCRQKQQQNQGQQTGKSDDQQSPALHTLSGRT